MINNKVTEDIEALAAFELNKGISPFELMHNITEEDYTEISIKKQNGTYICDVKFTEQDYNYKNVKLTYRYIYDNKMVLMKIVSIKNKNINVIWTREFEEEKLLLKIFNKIDKYDDKKYLYSTLPENLKYLINMQEQIQIP